MSRAQRGSMTAWRHEGSLDWRQTAVPGGVRLEVRDRTRIGVALVCGGGLVAVLGWAFFARLASASTASLVVHGALTVILAAFAGAAVLGRTRFEVAGGRLSAPGFGGVGIDAIEDVVVIRRGGYAGLAVRRVDGAGEALPPVFLSKHKAERVRAALLEVIGEARR